MAVMAGIAAAQPAGKPVLKFNKNGKFRIVQFTDTHLRGNCAQSDSVLVLIRRVLEMEKPDFVIFTGDVIQRQPVQAWQNIADVFAETGIPWAAVLGNHDNEYGISYAENIELASKLPYSLTENGPTDLSGNGNYVIRVQASGSDKTATAFYCLDAHGTIRTDQVEWYRHESKKLTAENGGKPLPALAFFHIPIPEFSMVERKYGFSDEKESAMIPNPGLFAAMHEADDVMLMLAGHDHNNNYIGCFQEICMAYGNITGWMSYGMIGRGARVIDLFEGERQFETWIRRLYDFEQDKEIWVRTADTGRKFFVFYENRRLIYRANGVN
ncbi:MAG: metallophosphoesterase family protein [Tannerella sp.]|nr:metallophosphoesterase family protein [Tannerella sp.]